MYRIRNIVAGIDPQGIAIVPLLWAWRRAQDRGLATMPCLARLLVGFDEAILAPVIDSLARLLEAALGRQIRVGYAGSLSGDERMLLDLLAQPGQRRDWPHLSVVLNGAIRSARIMLAMAGDGAAAPAMVETPGK